MFDIRMDGNNKLTAHRRGEQEKWWNEDGKETMENNKKLSDRETTDGMNQQDFKSQK